MLKNGGKGRLGK